MCIMRVFLLELVEHDQSVVLSYSAKRIKLEEDDIENENKIYDVPVRQIARGCFELLNFCVQDERS